MNDAELLRAWPKPRTDQELLFEVAKLASDDAYDSIRWHFDKSGKMSLWVDCSDIFSWACSDAETLTAETFPELVQAIADVRWVNGECDDGFTLYVARRRKMRPQGAWFKYLKVTDRTPNGKGGWRVEENEELTAQLHQLFNDAGPERGINLNNPRSQSDEYLYTPED